MGLEIIDCDAAGESESIRHQETDFINRLLQKNKIREIRHGSFHAIL